MNADAAWIWISSAVGNHGVFGYGFSSDNTRAICSCEACGATVFIELATATAQSLTIAIERFERRHLIVCAEKIPAARDRIRELTDGAPVTSDPAELRRMMRQAR